MYPQNFHQSDSSAFSKSSVNTTSIQVKPEPTDDVDSRHTNMYCYETESESICHEMSRPLISTSFNSSDQKIDNVPTKMIDQTALGNVRNRQYNDYDLFKVSATTNQKHHPEMYNDQMKILQNHLDQNQNNLQQINEISIEANLQPKVVGDWSDNTLENRLFQKHQVENGEGQSLLQNDAPIHYNPSSNSTYYEHPSNIHGKKESGDNIDSSMNSYHTYMSDYNLETRPQCGSLEPSTSPSSANNSDDSAKDTINKTDENVLAQRMIFSRHRTVFTSEQVELLKMYFEHLPNPTSNDYATLSKILSLPKKVVNIWFQNERRKKRVTFNYLKRNASLNEKENKQLETRNPMVTSNNADISADSNSWTDNDHAIAYLRASISSAITPNVRRRQRRADKIQLRKYCSKEEPNEKPSESQIFPIGQTINREYLHPSMTTHPLAASGMQLDNSMLNPLNMLQPSHATMFAPGLSINPFLSMLPPLPPQHHFMLNQNSLPAQSLSQQYNNMPIGLIENLCGSSAASSSTFDAINLWKDQDPMYEQFNPADFLIQSMHFVEGQ